MRKKHNITYQKIINESLSAININRGFIPTFIDLIIKPGQVIEHYLNRENLNEIERKKYFTFGRFFITSFALFALLSFFYGEDILNMTIDNSYQKDDWDHWFDSIAEQYQIFMYMIFIFPVAIFYRIVFLKHEFNLPIHIIIHTYTSPILCFLTIPAMLIGMFFNSTNIGFLLILFISFIYYWYINVKIYKKSFFKGLLINLIGVLAICLVSMLIFILAVLLSFIIVEMYKNGMLVEELQPWMDYFQNDAYQ